MAERDDLDFEAPEAERKGNRLPWFALGGVATLLVLAAFALYLREGEPPIPAPPPPPVREERPEAGKKKPPPSALPQEEAAAPPPLVLPDLQRSDDFVRTLAEALAGRPFPPAWMEGEDLVRRFVAAVDNVAEGHSPKGHFPGIRIKGDFAVSIGVDRIVLDPRGYGRYDFLAGTVSSLDGKKSADLYRSLLPLFREAYRDLGYPDRSFDETFGRAVYRILGVPVVQGEVVLLKGEKAYHFEDPLLEGLSPAEKHLLRMGPVNTSKIQEGLRRMASALGITAPGKEGIPPRPAVPARGD